MNGIMVTINDMLECRERRVRIQESLISTYHQPVLSFCMNIPGPIKTNTQIKAAFLAGKEALLKALSERHITILDSTIFQDATGDEWIMALNAPAADIKAITTKIEESHPLGRLFDMDVIGTDGMKLSRGTYRRCILCGCQAQECARSRKHSVEELQDKIMKMIDAYEGA